MQPDSTPGYQQRRDFETISKPAISPQVLTVLMLFASNVFMTRGVALFEYWLAVPANQQPRLNS